MSIETNKGDKKEDKDITPEVSEITVSGKNKRKAPHTEEEVNAFKAMRNELLVLKQQAIQMENTLRTMVCETESQIQSTKSFASKTAESKLAQKEIVILRDRRTRRSKVQLSVETDE